MGVAEEHVMKKFLAQVADSWKLHPDVIRGPSRRADIVGARRDFVLQARDAGVPITHIARFLNRHPNTIRRAA